MWPWPFLRIAHRGVPALEPENSLQGFLRAMALGADMVETDLRCTGDGVLVLAHDAILQHSSSRAQTIATMTLAELQAAFGAAAPALLEDALGLRVHGAPLAFNLDVKDTGLTRALLDVLRRDRRRDGIILSGRVQELIPIIRDHEPGLVAAPTYAAQRRDAAGRALVRLAPPLSARMIAPRLIEAARQAGARALSVEYTLLTPRIIALCHAHGIRLIAWTVDQPACMRRLYDAGIDAITTNRVDLLRRTVQPSSGLDN